MPQVNTFPRPHTIPHRSSHPILHCPAFPRPSGETTSLARPQPRLNGPSFRAMCRPSPAANTPPAPRRAAIRSPRGARNTSKRAVDSSSTRTSRRAPVRPLDGALEDPPRADARVRAVAL
ncbi:uncharacterized protein TRAVEDRAFT_54789 [Trametes versicolor FP-101664 SS1]|uniref:Uncharacterized protein n=1 Tax=Trametes versicolor (strain FP-101664) TaxID=717944 RepID=R7S619_TRAVS|nr:uncharacterized protein TRAVEDRAFT_54789 [Trametes versicolor FP-101664 SS1]EIW51198.1 hypothetical protein TRAVEDRAFT_54789 [Trametes versicolor FP-101664 SS1]